MTGRIPHIDFLRAICALYIVGFWHLINYTHSISFENTLVMPRITVLALSLFVFLSGYLLANKNIVLEKQSLVDFFQKRILRIYPLYLFALCIFLLLHLTDKSTALKAALGVSMFYGPSPPTLWFITMLLVFYFFAPLLMATAHNSRRFILLSASLFCIFLTLVSFSPAGNSKIILYFPAFALGIFFARNKVLLTGITKKYFPFAMLMGLIISLSFHNNPEESLISLPIAVFGPALIFEWAGQYEEKLPRSNLISLVSFCSFVMYLLHRPVFLSMKWLYFPGTNVFQALYLVLVCLPIIVLLSWIVQHGYDKFIFNRFTYSGSSHS